MLIREDVITRATPQRAWELLSDPSLHTLWNPRIVDTNVWGSDAPGLGYKYRVTLELSGRRTEFDAEIVEFTSPTRFVARLEERNKGDGKNLDRYVIESYDVMTRRAGTYVNHEVRIHHSGVNIFLRMLVWLIMKVGRPTEKTIMRRFAEIAEDDGLSAPSASTGKIA